jgi:ABC-type branched-subunit amino acid transport system substrate-binding protein
VLGRQVRLVPVDGSRPPVVVAADIARLVDCGAIDAVTGWHISPVRQAIARVTAGRVPYVYGPLYEGGERTAGLFLTGETPSRQLLPAMDWMADEHDVDRWIVIGNDYVWPRQTGARGSGACPRPGHPAGG